jgi:lipid-binding SYLF domain-containing protein
MRAAVGEASKRPTEFKGLHYVKIITRLFAFALLLLAGGAYADDYTDTVDLFKNAGDSASFFSRCYAYAVFPTVGEGGFIVGGARGKGRVFVHEKYVGDTTMTQLSAGFQLGGKAYSQIVFFEDKRALDEFETGSFEFSAGVSAIAVTAGASASAGTTGATSGASGGMKDAVTASGGYQKGVAVFTIAKGGLMYTAVVAGQKFSFTPR